ncbi:MAG: choice-of-anchor R domain-containing protein [Patescibacteria group bacterium]
MKKDFKKIKKNGGAAMLISVIFFLFISLAIISGLVGPSVREFRTVNNLIKSQRSFFLSESAAEDSYFRLKTGKAIGLTNTITLENNSATATISDSGYNEKTISSLGDVDSRQRKSELVLNTGVGVSFSYGVQTGLGGFTMENNSSVNGSVYSNGSITGSGSITGTALSANSEALTADQMNGSGVPSYDIIFGNANGTQDFAQSFQVSVTEVVNKVKLYLKKISTPSNLTIRIVSDSSGSPSTTTLASGPLSASLVSTTYGWVDVPFSSNPELTAGATYWIVIDGSTNSTRYYMIGANNNEYSNGAGKIGAYSGTWNNTSPSNLDGFFNLYLGGLTGLISGITVGTGGVGNAYAHTVNNSNIAGINYCQTGSGNNKSCNTTLSDPTQVAMPISDQNILDWKNEGTAGGVYSGNYTAGSDSSLGPKEITGDLSVSNGAHLTVTGTLWVRGNVNVSNNATVSLSSSYDTSEGVIVVDGIVNIGNNAVFDGSGSAGSYLMVLSTSTSTEAITLSNNGGAVILYAANGTVNLSNNAIAKSLNGKYIHLNNNAIVIYDSGLVNANFVNGPSGGWGITSWKEVQ